MFELRPSRLRVAVICCVLLCPLSARADQEPAPGETLAAEPALVFDAMEVDAGESYQDGVIEHTFTFVNRGERTVHVSGLEASHPPGNAEVEPDIVPPGARGEVRVFQPLSVQLGAVKFRFRVHTDDPEVPARQLVLETFVQSAYDIEWPFVDFGDVDRSRGKTATFELSSRETDRLRLARVVDAPPGIQVEVADRAGLSDQQVRLEITLVANQGLGLHTGTIHLQTDLPHQRDYKVGFRASVFGDVAPSENPVFFGATPLGQSVEKRIRLASRSGSLFEVERVEDSTSRLEVTVADCTEGAERPDCRELLLTLPAVRQGGFNGKLLVFLAGQAEPLPISHSGLVASPGARIRDLGEIDRDPIVRSSEDESPEP